MSRPIGKNEESNSSSSIKYRTRDVSPTSEVPIQASMPPPPVAMAASTLRIQALEEQLKQKDRIIHAFEAQRRSHLASVAEKAKQNEFHKMNKGWRKHNANPHTPGLYRSERLTEDEKGNVRTEKVIFVTEYKFAMERVKELDAQVGKAKAALQDLRTEQRDAYRKTQELIKVAEELQVKVASKTRMRIARSSPEEDQDTTTIDGNTADSNTDVNMGALSATTAPRNGRLILHPPKPERSLSVEITRSNRLKLRQPKRERSVSAEEDQPTSLRLSQPRADRVRSGRVLKTSAKAEK